MTHVCQYKMTPQELRWAIRARHRHVYAWHWRLAHVVIGLLLVIGCGVSMVRIVEIGYTEVATPMFFTMYGLFFLLGLILLFYKQVSVIVQLMNAKKNGLFGKEFKYETSMDGVASEGFGTDVTLAWRTFRESGVEQHGIILILPGGAFHWLPKDGFENEAAWEETAEIARKRLPKKDVDLIN
ncbi:MAG: hypothetical protein IKZ46_09900 [Victivallales bacterium]|nr:hypothetical protein [Victivallales bacterium]